MKKLFTLTAASLLLLGASQVKAQSNTTAVVDYDWLHCNFEIPEGGTTPDGKGWSTWDATSREIIPNPVKSDGNQSDYVFYFKNLVEWDILVNYWIDPKVQANIYEAIRFKVYVVKAGGGDTGTGSIVSFKTGTAIKSNEEAPKGQWVEMQIPFAEGTETDKYREVQFKLENYGSTAYFDDITFVAKTEGVINQSSITVTGAGNATEITTAGGTLQMSAAILPADATDKNISWSVSDKTVADIDGNTGILTAKGNGTVVVTAKSNDLQKVVADAPKGSVTITVSNQGTGIKGASSLKTEVIATSEIAYVTSPKTINQVTVYNITGIEVASQVVNSKETEVNISALASGIYMLKIQSENNEIALVKFVKK